MRSRNKIFIVLFLAFFSQTAFAAYTYDRSPAGVNISNPITIDYSFDTFADTGCEPSADGWTFGVKYLNESEADYFVLPYREITDLSGSAVFSVPVGQYGGILTYCDWLGDDFEGGTAFEGNQGSWDSLVMNVTNNQFSGLVIMGTSTIAGAAADLTASVQNTTSNAFPLIVLVLGLVIAFYALEAMFALMPEDKKKR